MVFTHKYVNAKNYFSYACEIGTVLGVLSYVIFQQGDEIKNQGFWTFLKQQVKGKCAHKREINTRLFSVAFPGEGDFFGFKFANFSVYPLQIIWR